MTWKVIVKISANKAFLPTPNPSQEGNSRIGNAPLIPLLGGVGVFKGRFFVPEGHVPIAHRFIGGNDATRQVVSRRDIRAHPPGGRGGGGRPSGTDREGGLPRAPGMNSWAIGECPCRDEKKPTPERRGPGG